MSNHHLSETNFAKALLQLQQSCHTYLDAAQHLLQAIDSHPTIEETNKKVAQNYVISTVISLLELQKVTYKKSQLHLQVEGILSGSFSPELIKPKHNKPDDLIHMKKYHLKKETFFKTIISYETTTPAPPWKPKHLYK